MIQSGNNCLLVFAKEHLTCGVFSINIVADNRLPEDRQTESRVGICIQNLLLANKAVPKFSSLVTCLQSLG